MLVSVLPFRRTRYKSQLMTDLPFSCMMGRGSLPQPGPAGASPAPELTALQPPGLGSPTRGGDAEGVRASCGLLLSAESRRGGISTPRV